MPAESLQRLPNDYRMPHQKFLPSSVAEGCCKFSRANNVREEDCLQFTRNRTACLRSSLACACCSRCR
jgi:hypothetical protein